MSTCEGSFANVQDDCLVRFFAVVQNDSGMRLGMAISRNANIKNDQLKKFRPILLGWNFLK